MRAKIGVHRKDKSGFLFDWEEKSKTTDKNKKVQKKKRL